MNSLSNSHDGVAKGGPVDKERVDIKMGFLSFAYSVCLVLEAKVKSPQKLGLN